MAILAAIGEEEGSRRVIKVAADLATAYDDTLVVVHVIPEEEMDEHIRAMRELPGYSDTGITDESDRAANFVRRMIEDSLNQDQQDRVTIEGRVGKPEDQVRSTAEEVDARYVVIGGRNQSPVGKAMFGSTTQSILLDSDRPVLTVRTPDSS